jgi:ATP-dependent Clp protease, protease subunit
MIPRKSGKNIYGEAIDNSKTENTQKETDTAYDDSYEYDINSAEYLFKQIEYGFNVNQEIIYLHTPIKDGETLYSIMTAINIFLHYRTEEDANRPITISLNSPGGDIYEMNGIIDYINSLPFKVNIVCRGQAISAAAWILACGTGVRAMSKHSTLMLHEGTYEMQDKFHNMKSSLDYFNHLEVLGYQMLADKTGIEASFWKDKCKLDWYITAEEALKLKLIDKII